MEPPDWSSPPAGITPCLQWIASNLRRVWDIDEEPRYLEADEILAPLLEELRAELLDLYAALVGLGHGDSDDDAVDHKFAIANDCYQRVLGAIDGWLSQPSEEALAGIDYLVAQGAAYLEQADSLVFQRSTMPTLEVSG